MEHTGARPEVVGNPYADSFVVNVSAGLGAAWRTRSARPGLDLCCGAYLMIYFIVSDTRSVVKRKKGL